MRKLSFGLILLLVPFLLGANQLVEIEVDSDLCPIEVYPFEVEVVTSDKIEWQTIMRIGNEYVNVDSVFAILFDPFQGGTLRSNQHGNLVSKPIQGTLVGDNVFYKYTVFSLDNPECPPLDPRARWR